MLDLTKFATENRNMSSMNLDIMSPLEIVTAMNVEDRKVPIAIENTLPQIAKVVEIVEEAFQKSARLFYNKLLELQIKA